MGHIVFCILCFALILYLVLMLHQESMGHNVFCIVASFDAPLGKHGSCCVLYCS